MNRKGKTKGIIIQVLIAMPLLTLLLALGGAKLILDGKIGEEKMEICACVIAGIAAFIISLYAAIRMSQKKMLWGLLTAGCYATMLLLGNLLFFGEGYGNVLPILGVVLATGLLGSFLAALKRRKYA